MHTSSGILESFLNSRLEQKEFEILPAANDLLDFNKAKKGADFLPTLNFYLGLLEDASGSQIAYEHLLPYMNQADKEKLLWDLQICNLLLCAQENYEAKHQKKENSEKYIQYCLRCSELIDLLNTDYLKLLQEEELVGFRFLAEEAVNLRKKKLQIAYHIFLMDQQREAERLKCQRLLDALNRKELNQSPEQGCCIDAMPVKYLGIQLAQLRASKSLLQFLNAINDKRLYWVWGGGFVKLLLDESLAPDLFNYDAKDTAHFPDPYTGCMSWALYFFRLSIHSSLFFKHLLNPSEEEKDLPWRERTNWRRRKYPILNDLLWGPANFFSFFWLNDMKMGQGPYLNQVCAADFLTTLLLVFDSAMAVLEYTEEAKIHEDEINQLDIDIRDLEQKIAHSLNSQKAVYEHRLKNLKASREQCEKNWHIQQISLVSNVIYTIGLLLAFSLVAFGGPSSAVVLVGTILCFAFTVLNNAAKNGIEVYKTHLALDDKKSSCKTKIELFLATETKLSDQEKKYLFLQIKELKAETEYQQALLASQKMHFFRSFLMEAFIIPAMVFLPFGLSVYPAIFAVMGTTHAMINSFFKVEKAQSPPFEQKEFEEFSKNPWAWLKKSPTASPCFFSKMKSEQLCPSDEVVLQP